MDNVNTGEIKVFSISQIKVEPNQNMRDLSLATKIEQQ